MKEIMCKDLIIVNIDNSVEEVAKIMKKYDIGFVPVSFKNKIVGVLTDRDIVIKILANKDNKIKGYLSNPISIDVNKNIHDALQLMQQYKVKRLLVKNNNKLVGIISLSDILSKDINVLETIKKIFSINKNTDTYITKINDFYL